MNEDALEELAGLSDAARADLDDVLMGLSKFSYNVGDYEHLSEDLTAAAEKMKHLTDETTQAINKMNSAIMWNIILRENTRLPQSWEIS